jgi:hypothetical protein
MVVIFITPPPVLLGINLAHILSPYINLPMHPQPKFISLKRDEITWDAVHPESKRYDF